jgi:hypothetical protein
VALTVARAAKLSNRADRGDRPRRSHTDCEVTTRPAVNPARATLQPMSQPIRADEAGRYGDLLRQIKLRTTVATAQLEQPPTVFGLETVALHLRMTLELVALSSLLTRRVELQQVAAALERKDYAEARKLAKKANVDYWPQPVQQVPVSPGRFDLPAVTEPFVTESGWGPEWGSAAASSTRGIPM